MEAALPRQVREQLEAAQRLEEELARSGPPAEPVEVPPPETPPASVEPGQQPAPIEPPAELAEDTWRKRYESLDGKYRSEVPDLFRQLRAKDEQIQELLRSQPAQPPQQPAPPVKPLVTSEDEDKFGSDLLDVARRVTRDEIRGVLAEVEALKNVLTRVISQVKKVDTVEQEVAQSRSERFWTEIVAAVPNWQEINADERWLRWLAEIDPLAGVPRQQGLDAATQALNSQRVIAYLKAFEERLPKATTPVTTQPSTRQSELARQVAPTRSSKTTVQPAQPRTYTGQEYTYWTDHRRVHDTPKEQLDQMLNELDRALAEGRIKF